MKSTKPTFFTIALVAFTLFISSCNEYKSFNSVTKVSQLAGNPFMYQLSKSLLGEFKTLLSMTGNKADAKKINLTTPLSQILRTQEQISTFKNVLNSVYKVPVKKLDSGWGSLGTVKDLVSFVAKNGHNFRTINF